MPFSQKKFPIRLVCDNVTSAANVGALLRIADAFGVEKVYFCGDQPPEFSRRAKKTARGAEKLVSFEIHNHIEDVVLQLKSEGHDIFSLEITHESKRIAVQDFTSCHKVALVIGNENYGISATALEHSDAVLHIEMFGQKIMES